MTDFRTIAAPRADFPEEIVHADGFLGWGVVGVVVALGLIALFLLYRYGYQQALRQGGHAIDENLKSLRRPVTRAARARPDELLEKSRLASEAFDARFAHTLALSAALNQHSKGLKTAVEGLKPAKDKDEKTAHKAAAIPASVTGSTFISINVTPPAEPSPPHDDEDKPVERDAQPIALWKAIQRLYEELHTRQALAVALKGAQDQLLFSPKWEKPRDDTHRRNSKVAHDL